MINVDLAACLVERRVNVLQNLERMMKTIEALHNTNIFGRMHSDSPVSAVEPSTESSPYSPLHPGSYPRFGASHFSTTASGMPFRLA
jgi:hypothetical protein